MIPTLLALIGAKPPGFACGPTTNPLASRVGGRHLSE
jgi:hypothetical protein